MRADTVDLFKITTGGLRFHQLRWRYAAVKTPARTPSIRRSNPDPTVTGDSSRLPAAFAHTRLAIPGVRSKPRREILGWAVTRAP